MATEHNSGHFSSGRSHGSNPKPISGPSPGALSDQWSDDGKEPHGGEPQYDMTLPEGDKAALGMASPLIRHGGGAHDDDVEQGLHGEASVATNMRGAQEFGGRSTAPKDVREHVKNVIDQNKELKVPFVVRNLTLYYFLTITVVILLSLAGQITVHVYINRSYGDAVQINISGRQRMLSQMLTKDALAIYFYAVEGENSTYFQAEMAKKSALWDQSYHGLVNGSDALGLSPTTDQQILDLFKEQEPYHTAMMDAVGVILTLNFSSLQPNTSQFDTLINQTNVLLANEGHFWKIQDNITIIYQNNADDHLNFLLILSWVLHGLVILTLILEGLFIIWPVARSLQRLIDERFSLIRRSLEAEAENRGVSILMMGYISHELQAPLLNLAQHLDASRDFLHTLEGTLGTPGDAISDLTQSSLKGAVTQVDKAIMCSELLNTVSGDIANLRNIELGRMALVVEVVDVADVVQQVLSVLAPKVPEGVQLRVDLDPAIETEHFRLDRHRLQQILLNMVDNSFRMTTSGEVIVRAKKGKRANTIRLEVQDSGEGLTEEQQQSLYEPVMDSGGIREGTGNLALYVVKLLVELQHGTFGVETMPGTGAVLWAELPAVSGGEQANIGGGPAGNSGSHRTQSSGRIAPEDVKDV